MGQEHGCIDGDDGRVDRALGMTRQTWLTNVHARATSILSPRSTLRSGPDIGETGYLVASKPHAASLAPHISADDGHCLQNGAMECESSNILQDEHDYRTIDDTILPPYNLTPMYPDAEKDSTSEALEYCREKRGMFSALS